jgi:hypothetical protein
MGPSIESAFVLINRASGPIRDIRRDLGDLQRDAEKAGGALDRIGGPDQRARIDTYERKLRGLAATSDTTAGSVKASWDAQERSISDKATVIERRVGSLQDKVDRWGRTRASASVDLAGFDRVNAQLSELERRLNRLDRQRATPAVGGGFGGGGAGGVAQVASSGGLSLPRGAGLAGGALALLPGVQALLGSSAALLGSASGAALGAGSIGVGGLGALGVGGALSMLVAKPAIASLTEITKAVDAQQLAALQHGAQSRQALTAQMKVNALLKNTPAAAPAVAAGSRLVQDYTRLSAPAKNQFYAGTATLARQATGVLPQITANETRATRATMGGATQFGQFLTGPQSMQFVTDMTRTYELAVPGIEHSVRNMASTFEHLATAARPFFLDAVHWVDTWTHGMAASTSDTAKVQVEMHKLVGETKDWGRLGGAMFRTVHDILTAGAPSGDSMVVSLTHTFDRWDLWLRDNPQKVHKFFGDAATTTSEIAQTLTSILHLIWQVGNVLTPIFDRALPLLQAASSLGPLGTALVGGSAFGAYHSLSGGGSAGALVAGGVLGRPIAGRGAGAVGGVGAPARSAFQLASLPGPTSSYLIPGLASHASSGAAAMDMRSLMLLGSGRQTAVIGGGLPLASRATPEAFQAAMSGYTVDRTGRPFVAAAARYGMPVSTVAPRVGWMTQARGRVGAAATSALRTAAPIVLISGALDLAGGHNPLSSGSVGGAALKGAGYGAAAGTFIPGLGNLVGAAIGGVGGAALSAGLHLSHPSAIAGPFVPGMARAQQLAKGGNLPGALGEVNYLRGQANWGLTGAEHHTVISQLDAAGAQITASMKKQGGDAATAWQSAFSAGAQRMGPERAMKQMREGMLGQLKQLDPLGRRSLANSIGAWAGQMERDHPKLRKPIERLMREVTGDMKQMGQNVTYYNGQILDGSTSQWQAIEQAMVDPASRAREKLSGIFGQITAAALRELELMGFSPKDAAGLARGLASGGAAATAAQVGVASGPGSVNAAIGAGRAKGPQSPVRKHARGGRLQGQGLQDTVMMADGGLGAPGELVVNRHTESRVDSLLGMFGTRLDRMVANETRPHSAPMGRATGGRVRGAYGALSPGRRDQGLDFGGSGPVGAVGSGVVRSVGLWPGWPGTGGIVYQLDNGQMVYVMEDFAPSAHRGQHLALGQTIGRATGGQYGIETGWANAAGTGPLTPYGGRPDGTAMPGAASFARFLATGSAGGLGGGGGSIARQIAALRAPSSGVGGVAGVLATRAGQMYAAGLTQRINQHLAASGRGGAMNFAGVPGSGGSASANQALGRAMMLAAGWGPNQWPALQALWTQESGWDATSVNKSSGAYGIPQALGHGHPFALGDARAQIAWGLNYIRGRYGSPAAAEAHERSHNWYARGGRLGGDGPAWGGWNAAGGDFMVNRPTVFGAGEGGRPERVRITPQSGGHATFDRGAVQVSVSIRREADRHIAKMIKRGIEKFVTDLDHELTAGVQEDERATLR